MRWILDRSLTLTMLSLFVLGAIGQVVTGWHAHNAELVEHGRAALSFDGYLLAGHLWEAAFENWESELLPSIWPPASSGSNRSRTGRASSCRLRR